jgi:hypothetical protein
LKCSRRSAAAGLRGTRDFASFVGMTTTPCLVIRPDKSFFKQILVRQVGIPPHTILGRATYLPISVDIRRLSAIRDSDAMIGFQFREKSGSLGVLILGRRRRGRTGGFISGY